MQKWFNVRTYSFIFWVAFVAVILIVMPDLDKLVREKGQLEVPATAESEQASRLLNELNNDGTDTYTIALLFHDEKGLTDEQMRQIDSKVDELLAKKEQLGIVKAVAHTESEQAAKQLVAEDGTTVIMQLNVDHAQGQINEVQQALYDEIELEGVQTYITGAEIISSDFSLSTQEGVKKTELIAVAFILIVLIIIFRSPIIPLISLITVGVSYIVSLGIVALLVEHYNLPFSNFTQIFLVVILFGVGTDYNILLFTRFKEELAASGHILKAIATTYTTAGKTVIYSGLAVLIGFVALFFAQFKMYLATAPVAIGVAVLLAVLLTLNPFFMAVFGLKLFWPIKQIDGHGESKFWHALSRFSFKRPFICLLLMAIIFVPALVKYSGTLNFNDLNEIDDSYLSKQAVGIIEDHYIAGFASPISVVVEMDESIATQEHLKTVDQLTAAINGVDGVAKVLSATRPEGERIEALYIDKQTQTLNEGLTDAESGVSDISSGLNEVTTQLNEPQDLSGVQTLIDGTSALQNGATQLQQALNELSSGLASGATGATELASGVASLQQGITPLANGVSQLVDAYGTLENGFSQMQQYVAGTQTMITQMQGAFTQISQSMQAVIAANPQLAQNQDAQTVVGAAQQALQNLQQLQTQAEQVNAQYAQAIAGFKQANSSLAQVQAGTTQLQSGAAQLKQGADALATGINNAATGSSTIANESSQFVTGLAQVNEGQQTLQSSLATLQEQMAELSTGLQAGADGLSQIEEGLQSANNYLAELSATETGDFYIPAEVLTGDDFKGSLDTYMSDDRHMMSMTVLLDVNPFTAEAMEIGKEIREAVAATIKGSTLEEANAYVGGKTMTNIDLQQIAADDFVRSATIMLIGIAIVLLIITRSLFQTVVTVGSLLLTSFAAMGVAELLNNWILGHDYLSWNVPFFAFIMIIALGVDYSIFLLMRYNEYPELGPAGIIEASKHMGGVVISAAIILGGTFAALIPSGILSLMQVAFVVIVGLILLSCFIMPMFLPMAFSLREKFVNQQKRMKKEK